MFGSGWGLKNELGPAARRTPRGRAASSRGLVVVLVVQSVVAIEEMARDAADEVRRLVRAAGSPERRLLGVCAQWAGAVDRSRRRAVGGDDLLGRDPVLHPALERAERVQGVGAGAAATVMHARRKEQAEELVEAVPVLRLVGGLLEVGDRPERGQRRVGPAVPHDQLSA